MSPPIRDGSGNSIGSIRLGDGTEISEVRTGAGDVVFSASAIPDSVVSLYAFEDDLDTSVAVDSQASGSNDANITRASYTTTAKVGSLALSHDGSDGETVSQNTVDISGQGDTSGFSISAYINFQRETPGGGSYNTAYAAGVEGTAPFFIVNRSGNIGLLWLGSDNVIIRSSISITAGTYFHIYGEFLSDGSVNLKVDGTVEGSGSTTDRPSDIGSVNHRTGAFSGGNYAQVIVDDFAPANEPLTASELQSLIDRTN
jgi:hypothetical protein